MKKAIKILFTVAMPLILLLFFCTITVAQHQPFFINSTEADGLSDNHVHCFLKDQTGYMWIGTANGLNRYDGNTYKIYKPSPDKKSHLSNGFVTAVAQDNKANIWVGTQKGLNCINATTGIAEVLNVTDKINRIDLSVESVWDVLPDGDDIWVAMDTKPLLVYNRKTKQSRLFDFKKFLKDNRIESTPLYHSIFKIIPAGNTGLWLATTDGIVHFNKSTGHFTMLVAMALDEISLFKYDATNGKLYCADEKNILYSYNLATKKTRSTSLTVAKYARKQLPPFYKQNNSFFIPSQSALALVNTNGDVVFYLTGDNTKNNSLPAVKINTVYTDRDGITWAGSDRGISKFVPKLNASLHVSFPQKLLFDPEFSLKNIFYQPANHSWLIASYADNKIWKTDDSTGMITEFAKPAAYKNDTCYSFYSRHPDTIFLLCDGVLLTYYNKTNKWNKIILPKPWNTGTVTCMAIDCYGDYWLGTRRKGLMVYSTSTKKIWTPYNEIEEANIIHALQFDAATNCMWIGTYSTGLHQYSFSDKKIKHIQRDDTNPHAIHASLITDLLLEGKNIWAASAEGGLAKCSTANTESTVVNYDYKNGLPDNNVYSIAKDSNGNIFFGTAKGIGIIGTDKKIKTLLNNKTGLPFTSCQQSIVCLANGYVATTFENQFFCFNNNTLLQQTNTAVVINQVVLNDTILITPSQSLFNYNENSFQFNFAALDMATPLAIQYYCMLEGYDKDWVYNQNQHSIRYASLPAGKYTFKVKAILANGEMLPQQAAWSFRVTPPFWKSWWFNLLAIMLTVVAVLYLVTRRIKTIRRQEKIKSAYEKKIAETEMQALRAQMNPHFMFNSLNSINNFILKNDADNASAYLTKFSRLMRLILDNSRSEWVLLENELKALELYIELEAVRFDNAFNYTINIAADISIATAMVPPLIIQPYVENAIWHGLMHRKEMGGRLDIRLWKNDNKLYIEIEDNGVGRAAAKRLKSKTATKQKSYGMMITAERMDIVNKVYNVNASVLITDLKESESQQGTRVLITLKYKIHDGNNS